MKILKTPRLWLPLLAVALVLPGMALAEQTTRTDLGGGTQLVQTLVPAEEAGGPLLYHALIVKPSDAHLRLASALGGETVEEQPGNGMEAVHAQVRRTGAFAGLNADFFPFTGDPLGLAIQKGELISEPNGRGAIGFVADGSVVIGRPRFRGAVSIGEEERALAGLNRRFGAGELVVFAPVYGRATPAGAATLAVLDPGGAKPSLEKPLAARVVSVRASAEATEIPSDRLILAGAGEAGEWLMRNARPGSRVTLRFATDEPRWSAVAEAVAGGPVLMRDGKADMNLETEGIGRDFSTTRHPRSAVGVTRDGRVILLAVDGRQALSRGVSLPELTAIFARLGAVDALNLDGGGSTCLSIRGLVINSPSDGQVRRVANSLLVFGRERLTPFTEEDGSLPVPAPGPLGSDVIPAASGEAWDGGLLTMLSGKASPVVWGTRNGKAFVTQRGVVHGYRPGAAEVLALDARENAASRWKAYVATGRPTKALAAWKDGALEVTVRDVNNNNLAGLLVTLTQPGGAPISLTTGANGTIRTEAGWLADERSPVAISVPGLNRFWPDGWTPSPNGK